MPCYPCTHCNKCGIFSRVLDLTCAVCGTCIIPGVSTCTNCGSLVTHNMKSGKIEKPAGAIDYYTEIEKRGL